MGKFFILLLVVAATLNLAQAEDPWDPPLRSYFENNNVSFLTQLRFYTYLYMAQRDAGAWDLSLLSCVASQLAHFMFADFDTYNPCNETTKKRALVLLEPYFERLRIEDSSDREFITPSWCMKPSRDAAQVAHWMAWDGPLPETPPPPPLSDHRFWADQFEQLRKESGELSDYQWSTIHRCERSKGCNWYLLANNFMMRENVPPETIIRVRALLMQGLYNGIIAEYTAKYYYCIPRPGFMDPTFKPHLFLESPSYPSGHATQATITATILSYFFPDATTYWNDLAHETSLGRLWAGVHFPEDIVQGKILGRKIAEQILTKNNGRWAHHPHRDGWRLYKTPHSEIFHRNLSQVENRGSQ